MDKIIMLLLLLTMLAACSANDNPEENNQAAHQVKVNNSEPRNVDRDEGGKIGSRLEKLASEVPKVNGANAVVFGKYAIVGIDIGANVERSEAGVIKYSVAEALKDDPHGARALIVADPDLNARLKEISADIKNGNPGPGIMNELADIAGRIIPEVPGKIVQPESDNQTETQKKKMTEEEKRKLEQKQENGSFQHK